VTGLYCNNVELFVDVLLWRQSFANVLCDVTEDQAKFDFSWHNPFKRKLYNEQNASVLIFCSASCLAFLAYQLLYMVQDKYVSRCTITLALVGSDWSHRWVSSPTERFHGWSHVWSYIRWGLVWFV